MTQTPRELRPDEVADRLAHYRILDVREVSEFEGPLGHIADAESWPLSELRDRIKTLYSDRPLLVVCRSGKRSGMACNRMGEQGIPDAINLVGGMIEWHARGLPVVRDRLRDGESIVEAFTLWLSQVRQIPKHEAEAFVRDSRNASFRV